MKVTHKPLAVGDIRQSGDEVKHNFGHNNSGSTVDSNTYDKKDKWNPVRLLNHAILPSDLVVSTFRRPINE
jgi:hypothetical protein